MDSEKETKNIELKFNHLQMLQQCIERMASNSFVVKGWAVTSVGAMYVFWFSNLDETFSDYILWLIFFLTVLFWWHDAYYLKLERDYRNKYEIIRKSEISTETLFDMSPEETGETVEYTMITRKILVLSYGIISIITIIIILRTMCSSK